MEEILLKRNREIAELTNFTAKIKRELEDIASASQCNLVTSAQMKTLICPFDSSHRLYPQSVEKHIEHCLWKAEGYDSDDMPLSIPSVCPDAPTSINLDQQMIENILQRPRKESHIEGVEWIPRTSDRLFTTFTPDERRKLYDYVIAHTEQPDIGEDIADLNNTQKTDTKTSSYLELLVQERNLKRRRVKHRGVHTNKKSQTEIMREVIAQQMEMFSEYLAEKNSSAKIVDSQEWTPPKGENTIAENYTNRRERTPPKYSHNRHDRDSESRRDLRDNYHENNDTKIYGQSISRSSAPRESSGHRHSKDRKKSKKRERSRSRDRHHHKHKSKSKKRSHSREKKHSRKRRRSP